MFISKYVKPIKLNEKELVLYNKFNGALYCISDEDWVKGCSDELLRKHPDLIEEKFVVEKENTPKQRRTNDSMDIVVEVSNDCNLKCLYCYENDKKTRQSILPEVQDAIIEYIKNVFEMDSKIDDVAIRYIGGEPLLCKDVILKMSRKINQLAKEYNRNVIFAVDTNGTIPMKELWDEISNLSIHTTLSLEDDHNRNRPALSGNSYQQIIKNLLDLQKKPGNHVYIRYNTNEKNVNEFEAFVRYVRDNLPICEQIKAMYTDMYDYNSFKNGLSLDEFKKWNSSDAIKVLIDNGYPINLTLGGELTICEAYQKYSCKVYSDGVITLCDSMFHSEGKANILDVYDNPDKLEEILKEYRNYDPMLDEECANCVDVAICSGKLFCHGKPCEYEKRMDETTFIKTYVTYAMEGLADSFINM